MLPPLPAYAQRRRVGRGMLSIRDRTPPAPSDSARTTQPAAATGIRAVAPPEGAKNTKGRYSFVFEPAAASSSEDDWQAGVGLTFSNDSLAPGPFEVVISGHAVSEDAKRHNLLQL